MLLLLQWRWPAEHADGGGGGWDDVVAMLHVYKVVFGWVILLLLLQWRWPAEHADGGGGGGDAVGRLQLQHTQQIRRSFRHSHPHPTPG